MVLFRILPLAWPTDYTVIFPLWDVVLRDRRSIERFWKLGNWEFTHQKHWDGVGVGRWSSSTHSIEQVRCQRNCYCVLRFQEFEGLRFWGFTMVPFLCTRPRPFQTHRPSWQPYSFLQGIPSFLVFNYENGEIKEEKENPCLFSFYRIWISLKVESFTVYNTWASLQVEEITMWHVFQFPFCRVLTIWLLRFMNLILILLGLCWCDSRIVVEKSTLNCSVVTRMKLVIFFSN